MGSFIGTRNWSLFNWMSMCFRIQIKVFKFNINRADKFKYTKNYRMECTKLF